MFFTPNEFRGSIRYTFGHCDHVSCCQPTLKRTQKRLPPVTLRCVRSECEHYVQDKSCVQSFPTVSETVVHGDASDLRLAVRQPLFLPVLSDATCNRGER